MADDELARIRREIDALDVQLQELISRRATLAKEVGQAKSRNNGDGPVNYYRPEREAQVLRAVKERNAGPLKDEEIVSLFREIMSACLAQEEPVKVGYLGPEGTFTQSAVMKHFGHAVHGLPLATIEDVFREVESGIADYGIVPVENSTEGTINHTLDMFLTSPLHICGEVELPIRHHLLGAMNEVNQVERVVAHPQALAQCRAWLREYLPDVELVPATSNAEGARRATIEPGTAAIAGDAAADVYGLHKLVQGIEDRPDNTTRFFVIGQEQFPPSGDDRTTLLLSAPDTEDAGALYKLLAPLAADNVNMTRIESRPSRQRKWHYVFFIDIDGHTDDATIARALGHLEQNAQLFRVLGSYPKAVI